MSESLLLEFHKQQEEQRRKLQLNVAKMRDHDSEHSAKVWSLSAATGLPNEIVAADYDNLDRKVRQNEYSYDDYTDEKTGSPIFNELALEDPYNWAVLKRDRKNMNAIERTIHSMGLAWDRGMGTLEMSNIGDRKIAGTSLPGDEDVANRLQSLMEAGDLGAGNMFTKALVYSTEQLPIQGWLLGQAADEMMIGGMAGGAVGSAVPGIGTLAGFGVGLRSGLFAGRAEAAFRLERGLAYNEFVDLGFEHQDALLFSNGVGAVNAALESFGAGAMTKRIPGFRNFQRDAVGDALARVFSKPTFRQAVTRATLQFGEQLGTEVVTEILQESTLYAAREHMKATARDAGDLRPEMTEAQPGEFMDMVGDIAIKTMYGSVFLSAAGPITNYKRDAKRARTAEENAAKWAMLGNSVDASTTKDDAPTAWEKFVERIQEKGPLKEVRFDAQGWRDYWQSQKVNPAEIAKEMGFDLDAMEVTDTDVVIPFGTYLEKLAPTEHHMGLIREFRGHHDDMTLREQEQWGKDSEKKIKEFEKTLAKEFDTTVSDEIEQIIFDDLTERGGTEPKAAKTIARFEAAKFTVLAEKEGKDPLNLFKQYYGGIKKQIPEALQKQDIDMEYDPILDDLREGNFPRQREIFGESLFDMIRKAGGIQDQGGELAARDVVKQVPGMVSGEGLTVDAIAELAFDQGYITEHDSEMLMEAFDRELGGDLQFSASADVNQQLETRLRQLETAAKFLDEEQIDLNEMTNAEVREYLKGVKTLEQSNDSDLKQWTDLVMAMALREESMDAETTGADRFDSVLGRAQASMPRVAEQQDFKDVMFTDKFIDSNGKSGTATISAQQAYDKAVKQRNLLKRLADCVNG